MADGREDFAAQAVGPLVVEPALLACRRLAAQLTMSAVVAHGTALAS